jgi:hypothetical protein
MNSDDSLNDARVSLSCSAAQLPICCCLIPEVLAEFQADIQDDSLRLIDAT